MLRFQWCFNKILSKIHVYGWVAGTYNQHLISMVYVNIDVSPIGGDVFKNYWIKGGIQCLGMLQCG